MRSPSSQCSASLSLLPSWYGGEDRPAMACCASVVGAGHQPVLVI
jgi:hypothetical protein